MLHPLHYLYKVSIGMSVPNAYPKLLRVLSELCPQLCQLEVHEDIALECQAQRCPACSRGSASRVPRHTVTNPQHDRRTEVSHYCKRNDNVLTEEEIVS
jgi:hypothetical protein